MSLRAKMEEETRGFEGVIGVAVHHLSTGESASINGQELFPTASVFKLPLIVELYRLVEAGELSLDDKKTLREADKVPGSGILKELSEGLALTVRDLVRLMMILSDNTATDILLGRVGMGRVNEAMASLGLGETRVVASCRDLLFDLVGANELPPEERILAAYQEMAKSGTNRGTWSLGTDRNNVTTPEEMNRLLSLIEGGKAASRESCDEILAIMAKCQTGEYRVPKYLPATEVRMYRKTGSLPGIRNDVGIIEVNETGERYCISCFTKGAKDIHVAEEAIAKVSRVAYEYFTKRKQTSH
jgi:beta-lactamase class A